MLTNWNYKTWSPRKQFIVYVILVIFFTFLFSHRIWAEETAREPFKEVVFNTLSAAVLTFIAFIETSALRNPYSGAIVTALITKGVYSALHFFTK